MKHNIRKSQYYSKYFNQIDIRLNEISEKMRFEFLIQILIPFLISLSAGFWSTYFISDDNDSIIFIFANFSLFVLFFLLIVIIFWPKMVNKIKEFIKDDTDIEIIINEDKLIEYINMVATSYYYINDIEVNKNQVLKDIYIEEAINLLEVFLKEVMIAQDTNSIEKDVKKRLNALLLSTNNCYDMLINNGTSVNKLKELKKDIDEVGSIL